MDVGTVTNLITAVGFPIVACIYMAKYITKNNENTRNQIENLNNERKTVLTDMKESIDNNTRVIEKMYEFFSRESKKGDDLKWKKMF